MEHYVCMWRVPTVRTQLWHVHGRHQTDNVTRAHLHFMLGHNLVDHPAHDSPRCLILLMSDPTTAFAVPGVTISGAA
eukprot:7551845-Pyramimonas_sp.AAC.1